MAVRANRRRRVAPGAQSGRADALFFAPVAHTSGGASPTPKARALDDGTKAPIPSPAAIHLVTPRRAAQAVFECLHADVGDVGDAHENHLGAA
ncbi:hypothetical protein [Sorangium sp. So ce1000]|uniref:hypothetical protein n=1 Tax=Sorangium sp. So ce1000 TaxID=3133325 RepID=UPI003F61823E